MKKQTIPLLAGLGLLAMASAVSVRADLTITTGYSAMDLINTILAATPNITPVSASYLTGDSAQFGKFTGAEGDVSTFPQPGNDLGRPHREDNLPFSGGILLSTGQAVDAVGPNNTRVKTTIFSETPSTFDIVGAVEYDVAALEFVFINHGERLQFDYAFGSEEYFEFIENGYNDTFQLLIEDLTLGGPQINLAKIDGDDIGVDSVNPFVHSEYYTDNTLGGTPLRGDYDLQFDGLVGGDNAVHLQATHDMILGHQYRLVFVIADINDANLDSGVFLGGGSLASVPEPSTYLGGLALAGLMARRLRRKA